MRGRITMTNYVTQSYIKELLNSYTDLEGENRFFATTLLRTVLLSGEHNLLLALRYNFGLTPMQTREIMNVELSKVIQLEEEALEILEAVANGYPTENKSLKISYTEDINDYLDQVETGKVNPLTTTKACYQTMIYYRAYKLKEHTASVLVGLEEANDERLAPASEVHIYDESPNNVRRTKYNDALYNQDRMNNVCYPGEVDYFG